MNTQNNKVEIEVIRKEGEYVVLAYHVGGDPLSEYDWQGMSEHVKWVAYHYEAGSYEGSGSALLAFDDGTFALADLGHCSCYGPTESLPSKGEYTLEEIQARIGKDFNGNEMLNNDWGYGQMIAMWEAAKVALNS